MHKMYIKTFIFQAFNSIDGGWRGNGPERRLSDQRGLNDVALGSADNTGKRITRRQHKVMTRRMGIYSGPVPVSDPQSGDVVAKACSVTSCNNNFIACFNVLKKAEMSVAVGSNHRRTSVTW